MRPLAQRLTERVVLALGEKEWPIFFSHDALLEIEEVSGKSVLSGEVNLLRPTATVLRLVVTVMLARGGCDNVPGTTAKLLHPARRGDTQLRLIKAWKAAMPQSEPWRSPRKGSDSEEQPKSQTWPEIWADNRICLRLTDEEWLGMTPRIVQLLSRERMELVRHLEWGISSLTAATINHGARPAKELVPDERFMLHPWPKKESKAMSGNEIMARMSRYAAKCRE